MARRVSQSIGKWPKGYAGHRKMARKAMQSIAKRPEKLCKA
jgi:hypothetical protein